MVIFSVCWALGSSFFMLIQFHTYTYLEWFAFFLVVPVFYTLFSIIRHFLATELKPYLVTQTALVWSRWLCPVIMIAVYSILIGYLGQIPKYRDISSAVNAQQQEVADMTGSAVVYEVSQLLAYYNGAKIYALGRLGEFDTMLAFVLLGIGGLVIFYNACAILSCFLIPGNEYRRVFGPLSNADTPPPVPQSRIAVIMAITTFISLFIYVPLFTYLEAWLQQSPEVRKARELAQEKATNVLEEIDNQLFNKGTIAKLQQAKVDALHQLELNRTNLMGQIDRAFDRMELNVDGYLDWYYSLVGEYTRIGKMLMGELEDYMYKKLQEHLQRGDTFQDVQKAISDAIASHEDAKRKYELVVKTIMEQNRVQAKGNYSISEKISSYDFFNTTKHQDFINLNTRLLSSAGGGAVAGIVTAVAVNKVLGKILGKGVIKLASKALAKVVATKVAGTAGGAGAGATVGAVIGSVIPGAGTAIGAAIGGVVGGLVAGLTVDKMLLMLEEALSREQFKSEIMASIQEARADFKAGL